MTENQEPPNQTSQSPQPEPEPEPGPDPGSDPESDSDSTSTVSAHRAIWVAKPREPGDERLLADPNIIMPQLKKLYGVATAVQVILSDIFVLLWHLNREGLYHTACLNLLFPREWTDFLHEDHSEGARRLPDFDTAVEKYEKRTSGASLDDSPEYYQSETSYTSYTPSEDTDIEWRITRFVALNIDDSKDD
ncbi:hypothetical protein AAE478_008125 [Parahypoxylon ruwenzoriense]